MSKVGGCSRENRGYCAGKDIQMDWASGLCSQASPVTPKPQTQCTTGTLTFTELRFYSKKTVLLLDLWWPCKHCSHDWAVLWLCLLTLMDLGWLRTEGIYIFMYQFYHDLTQILLRDNRDKLRADCTDEFVLLLILLVITIG